MKKNCILEVDSPSYPPEIQEYIQCGCESCILEYLLKLEEMGEIDRFCKTCQEVFISQIKEGKSLFSIFAPRHKASPRCKSGKHAHCTCDTCF